MSYDPDEFFGGLLFLRVAFSFLRTFNKLIFYMYQPNTIPFSKIQRVKTQTQRVKTIYPVFWSANLEL